jgi:hypothetical protein
MATVPDSTSLVLSVPNVGTLLFNKDGSVPLATRELLERFGIGVTILVRNAAPLSGDGDLARALDALGGQREMISRRLGVLVGLARSRRSGSRSKTAAEVRAMTDDLSALLANTFADAFEAGYSLGGQLQGGASAPETIRVGGVLLKRNADGSVAPLHE